MLNLPLRFVFAAAATATLFVTAPALADGTPTQPPPDQPPSQPLQPAQPQVQPQQQQPQVQGQPQQVPSYGTYQQRKRKQGSRWYGWQTLIVDGSWIIGGPVLATVDPGLGGALIVGGYLVGPPIVHFAHGRVGRGFGDFGIRIGAPIVLGAVGYLALHDSSGSSSADVSGAVGLVLGALLGFIGAIVIDAAVLAYEPADEDEDDDAKARATRRTALRPVRIVPMVSPQKDGGFVFGLSGSLF